MLVLFSEISGDKVPPIITATPAAGAYNPGQLVTLTANEPATIYYTVDGSVPTTSSPVYSTPIVIGAATLKALAVDQSSNQSAIYVAVYSITAIDPLPTAPAGRKDLTVPSAPGTSGNWSVAAAPLAPNPGALAPIYGLTAYTLTLNGTDITALASQLTITEAENTVFGTCSFDLPVGMRVDQDADVLVTIGGVARSYILEEVSGEGPKRSLWCRAAACMLDAPHSAEISWNAWDNSYSSAQALAVALASGVVLQWDLPDWTLPPQWELTGTPIECLQTLVQACAGIVISTPAGGLQACRRWPIRPPNMPALTPAVVISRDTALAISCKEQVGKGWGSLIVYGYDPSADLPELVIEENSPKHGSPVYIRLYWRSPVPPPFASFLTNGIAVAVTGGTEIISAEEVTFDNGFGSTKYPITTLHSYDWVGDDQGNIFWLTSGDNRELCMENTAGRGIANVTYTTKYDRWKLTGQTASKVIFGVDVGQGQVSAKVSYSSGGSVAPAVTAPLLHETAICIEAGTAYLDESRARQIISADMPLTSAPLLPGTAVQINDPVTGVVGNGKITSCSTTLDESKTMLKLEVQICH